MLAVRTVTSTGVGDDKAVQIHVNTRILSLYNVGSGVVTCFLRALTNTPGLPIYASSQREIELNRNAEQIVLQFAAAGSLNVEQRGA